MNLERTYEAYIACLNAHDLSRLGEYVGDEVIYNGSLSVSMPLTFGER